MAPQLDTDRSSLQQAVYLQHEIKLTRAVIINAGLRYDRYERFQRVTPRAALIVMPSATQSFKYLFGSAFRAPNENELNVLYFGERVLSLRPEAIDTHEIVWERYFNSRVRTSASAYWYKADRLITNSLDDSTLLGVTFVNQGQVRAGAWSSRPDALTAKNGAVQLCPTKRVISRPARVDEFAATSRPGSISLPTRAPVVGVGRSVEARYRAVHDTFGYGIGATS